MSFFKKDKKKDPRNYRTVSLTSVYGKIMKQILLQGISRYMKDRKTTGHNKLGNNQSLDAGRAVLPSFILTLARLLMWFPSIQVGSYGLWVDYKVC